MSCRDCGSEGNELVLINTSNGSTKIKEACSNCGAFFRFLKMMDKGVLERLNGMDSIKTEDKQEMGFYRRWSKPGEYVGRKPQEEPKEKGKPTPYSLKTSNRRRNNRKKKR